MIAGIVPLGDIRPGTVMDLTLGRRPNRTVARPLEKLTFRARFDLRVELARLAGALTLTRIPIAVDDTPLRIQGLVGASLYRSARAAGVPARAVEAYIRALDTQSSVPAGINSSDRFDIIIEHRRAATGETETGDLLYAGLDRSSGQRPAADAVAERRPQPMVRGLRRRPPERRHDPAGAGPDQLQFRDEDAPDPRLLRGCTGASTSAPATARRSSPSPTAPSPAPAGRAAMAIRSGSATPAASAPPIRI